MPYPKLNQENGYIWRIVHKDNLAWHLQNGLHCQNSISSNSNFQPIGNSELIQRRTLRSVPIAPGGTLSDYVPFYFTPFSPMMYCIHTGRGDVPKQLNEDILILVSSLPTLTQKGVPFIFTDRHAYTQLARYFDDVQHLREVDWPLLQARNFKRNPDDPEQFERYQAEALVYKHMPVSALIGVICYTDKVKQTVQSQIAATGLQLPVHIMQGWYFQ